MSESGVAEVCGLIAEDIREGDVVTLTIGRTAKGHTLNITTAPSHVLEDITDNGYYIRAEFGVVVVSPEEG